MSNRTVLLTRFDDELAADTLARYIAGCGVSCDVEHAEAGIFQPGGFGVRVAQDLLPELKASLQLVPLGAEETYAAANIVAASLAREGVAVCIDDPNGIGAPVAWMGAATTQNVMVYVPAPLSEKARTLLNDTISDQDLEALALSLPPE